MTKERMSYTTMASLFRAQESRNSEAKKDGPHLTGFIVFTEDSFDKPYSLESRTYEVSSDNKAYKPNMGGYSIFGYATDGSDPGVRLDWYMYDEHGGADGWKVDHCYMLYEDEQED